MKSSAAHRPRRLLAAVALGGIVLVGCTSSTPSNKRVALDAVETLTLGANPITEAQRQCMEDLIEDDYSEEQLDAIANAPENLSMVTSDPPTFNAESGTPELEAFVEDLQGCLSEIPPTTTSDGPSTTGGEATTVPSSPATAPATSTP